MIGFAVILFSIFALANSAFAVGAGTFDKIYMTDADGSTTPKDSFGWDEQPWLYLRLLEPGFNLTLSFWKNPDNKKYFDIDVDWDQDIWHTLKYWDDIKELGEWHVSAMYFQPGSNDWIGRGSADFTVTPEPVSSVLFLVGGISLAATRLKRRKK